MIWVPVFFQRIRAWGALWAATAAWSLPYASAQNRFVEVVNGNIVVHLGATNRTRDLVGRLSEVEFNRVLVGSQSSVSVGAEIIQTDGLESGFTLAESISLDMLVASDRNPDRFSGANALAIKAILVAGARIHSDGLARSGQVTELTQSVDAGLVNRHRSLEIFSSGRKVAGSVGERAMGWDRSLVFSGHPNRYRFSVAKDQVGDFSAVLALNPELAGGDAESISVKSLPRATLNLRGITENGQVGDVLVSSRGDGLLEYIYLGTLAEGAYILEVESETDGLNYGLAWHSQVHGMVAPSGDRDPVFLFRRGLAGQQVEMGTRVQFSGVAFGAMDNVVTVEYYAGSEKIGETDRPEFDFSWIASQTGISGIYAVVTDRYGSQVFSSVSRVDVAVPGTPPLQVDGPVLPENLSGVYFGSVSVGGSKGWVALSVLSSGRATCLGYLSDPQVGFVGRNGVFEPNGQFMFPSIDEIEQTSASADRSIPVGALLGAIRNGVATGTSADGKLAISATRSGSSGPLAQLEGLLELGILNRDDGRIFLVSDRSGKTKGIVCFGDVLVELDVVLTNSGTLSLDLGDGKSLMLELGDASGQVSGILSFADQPDEELLGIRDSAERRDKIANISTRGLIGKGNGILIAGFVVEGDSPKQVLIRAVGPSLANLGVVGMASDPRLTVRRFSDGVNSNLAINDDWDSSSSLFGDIGANVGAFPLLPGKTDAAIILTLEPGIYTAEMSDPGRGGLGLIEVYDAESTRSSPSDRIVNISTRGKVEGGKIALVGGFVVEGNAPKMILVRGVGPSLANLGISGFLNDTTLKIDLQEDGQSIPIQENDDWDETTNPLLIRSASEKVGAFPLDADGKDAAILVLLKPGAYTARVGATGTKSGIALLEIYEVGDN